jgi:tetratricopeptide (TPR) repeat protein
VQRAGDAVHINVQLIDGRDDSHLWAESYDRELKKVFEVEREVAETVATKLKARLSPQDTKELSRVPTSDPQAYDRYLKGEYVRNEFKAARVKSVKPAIEFFKEAIALDPHFALAYAKLAYSEFLYDQMEERSLQMVAEGRTHLAKALELEPDLIEAHLLQAVVYWILDHDLNRALDEVEPLLARAPNDARVVATIGVVKGGDGRLAGPARRDETGDRTRPSQSRIP